jgi:hypothetical protein
MAGDGRDIIICLNTVKQTSYYCGKSTTDDIGEIFFCGCYQGWTKRGSGWVETSLTKGCPRNLGGTRVGYRIPAT